MKKLTLLSILILSVLLFSGCGVNVNYVDEQKTKFNQCINKICRDNAKILTEEFKDKYTEVGCVKALNLRTECYCFGVIIKEYGGLFSEEREAIDYFKIKDYSKCI